MIGKIPHDLLEELVLDRTGADDPRVVQGPAYGEDTAAIRLDETILVINADPISLAVERVGTLGVDIACNDVAATGATPAWLSVVAFLPNPSPEPLDTVTAELDEEASRLGVAIGGGHSEYARALDHPMLVLTCLGLTDRYVPTGGANPDDVVLMTKSTGIEATAILATDFHDRVVSVPAPVVEQARGDYDEVSVVIEALARGEFATAMHDPTEGGLLNGLIELAFASDVLLEIDGDAILFRGETRRLCDAVDIDPLTTFGSVSLLATIPSE